jgi:uncharacterized damage-inducible protein DinB
MNIDKTIKAWHQRLDAVTQKVESEFGELSAEQLNWKLSAEKWSIAEVLEHLNLVNASYEKILTDAVQDTSDMGFTGSIGFVAKFLGKRFMILLSHLELKK